MIAGFAPELAEALVKGAGRARSRRCAHGGAELMEEVGRLRCRRLGVHRAARHGGVESSRSNTEHQEGRRVVRISWARPVTSVPSAA